MSGWTVDTLKEHFDALWAERDKRISDAFAQRDEAVRKAIVQQDHRLDGMNEFRDALKNQEGTFITRKEAMSLIVACCAVTGMVVGILTFAFTFFVHK